MDCAVKSRPKEMLRGYFLKLDYTYINYLVFVFRNKYQPYK